MDIKVLLGGFAGLVGAIAAFMLKYKDISSAIALRIERDTADGTWTNEEKQAEAIDIYNQQIKPKLPWFLQIIPTMFTDKIIKSIIAKICKDSKTVTVTQ